MNEKTGLLHRLLVAFDLDAQRYAEVGADDPEVHIIFQQLLARAWHDMKPEVPQDSDGWELFDCKKSRHAALTLAGLAQKCVRLIESFTETEKYQAEVVLRAYCWRIDWDQHVLAAERI